MMKNHADYRYIDADGVDVLNCRRLPARLVLTQVAVLLNFQHYELLILTRLGLLKCLNSPSAGANCRKFFSADYILSLASDPGWLGQATKAVGRAIHEKNRGKSQSCLAPNDDTTS
jgi:hypothetical protein